MSLKRFHEAQKYSYETALNEIKNGRKCSCWMWYIFPQVAGLGMSSTAQYYAIANLQEAVDYMSDPVLRERLLEISGALLALETNNANQVFGFPDNFKLQSSMTLFAAAAPEQAVFKQVLEKFFGGEQDRQTLRLIGKLK